MSKLKLENLSSSCIEVMNSTIHGRGVFATSNILKGQNIIEYAGERISWKEALRRHPHDPSQPNHTFYFSLSNGKVIDGNSKGNEARWINHSCQPNCEAREEKDKNNKLHVYIYAKRNIKKNEELFYDYALDLDSENTLEEQKNYSCFCETKKCRGSMLAKI
jgi:SET domain-containing protein